ncbi:hypothetical protein [Streptomyces sp. NPDC048637]|uniref:hypothetical protein n=1 Tax=Streptomyces sp. NPDC048637 TaxID=3155636 RepID=UPI00344591F4
MEGVGRRTECTGAVADVTIAATQWVHLSVKYGNRDHCQLDTSGSGITPTCRAHRHVVTGTFSRLGAWFSSYSSCRAITRPFLIAAPNRTDET